MSLHLSAPQPLAAAHLLDEFECGDAVLDEWLKRRAVVVSQNAGFRALLVHALHDRAKEFYEHYGFQSSPLHPMSKRLAVAS